MIKEIEELMVHWGEQRRQHGLSGGVLGSQLGTIIEWGGCPPRGTPGSRIPSGTGGGLDHIAYEVDAAVAELERMTGNGPRLSRLAEYRYCIGATVREQMRVIEIAEDADRTYRNWVHRLHQQVMLILTVRSGRSRGYLGQQRENAQCRITNNGAGRARS
jgi:hypothetical protein